MKTVIKNWKDLRNIYATTEKKEFSIVKTLYFNGVTFKSGSLQKCVKILNVLGGDFEYKEVEIIDTFEKFRKFLILKDIYYTPIHFSNPFEKERCRYNPRSSFTIKEIEEEYNVDLKILRR